MVIRSSFHSGDPSNRKKIGMVESAPKSGNFFYNDFITHLLQSQFTTPDKAEDNANEHLLEECLSTLQRIAFVEIEMSSADALVYTKVEATAIDLLTGVGGLLSLYMGASFLSLVEMMVVLMWLLFFIIRKVANGCKLFMSTYVMERHEPP